LAAWRDSPIENRAAGRITGSIPSFTSSRGPGSCILAQSEFVAQLRKEVANQVEARARLREQLGHSRNKARESPRLPIDDFRRSPKYQGDGNRIDLAYAIYALSHNVPEEEIRAAIGSRDLNKKGLERRQRDYINRTVEKARALCGCSGIPLHRGRGRPHMTGGPER
jgi:hypothetical protein